MEKEAEEMIRIDGSYYSSSLYVRKVYMLNVVKVRGHNMMQGMRRRIPQGYPICVVEGYERALRTL